jgi:phage shock protein C
VRSGTDPDGARPPATHAGGMTETSLHQNTTPAPARRLLRSRTDRMLGGVCGGAAELLGVDAAILRIGLVAATLLGFGAGAVVYLACWLIVPES